MLPKVKIFLWRACNDALLTKVNLTKRKVLSDACCACVTFLMRA